MKSTVFALAIIRFQYFLKCLSTKVLKGYVPKFSISATFICDY